MCTYREDYKRLVPEDNVVSDCPFQTITVEWEFRVDMEECDLNINIIESTHSCKYFIRFFINKKGHSCGAALSPYEN
jgi:hypothetical protein